MMALNVETVNDDGFERQNWEVMMGLNTKIVNDDGPECLKLKMQLWTSNWKCDDGFEYQAENAKR